MQQPVLIFDAYGTLVELDDFFGRLRRGFAARGLDLPSEAITGAAYSEMRYYMGNASRARDESSYREVLHECAQIVSDALAKAGHTVSLTLEETARVLSESIHFRVFPDTKPVLEELRRRGVPLAVLSNWDFRLPLALREVGLDGFFEFILTSAQAGAEKPALAFFQAGLQRVRAVWPGRKATDCVYIGDHYEKDVLGSRAAGFRPFWLVRDKRDLASGDTHEATDGVPRLRTLQDILKFF